MNKNIHRDKYTYHIQWSEEDDCHIGRCVEFPLLAAHGDTSESALREIQFVVAETIKWLDEEGEPIPNPTWMALSGTGDTITLSDGTSADRTGCGQAHPGRSIFGLNPNVMGRG